MTCLSGPTLHSLEARQLQSLAQVKQLSQEMEHLQDALRTAPQHAQAAQQQPAAWPGMDADPLEHPMSEMSLGQTGSQLTSHPVSLTPDTSPARMVPVDMAGYNGIGVSDANIPNSIGLYSSQADGSDAVNGSLTVPVLFPGSTGNHR